MNPLSTISPIDGRYHSHTEPLADYFSECALAKYRVMVEIEYLISLSNEKGVTACKPLSAQQQKKLRSLYEQFSIKDALRVKAIEKTTNHDVKAVEYFIAEKLKKMSLGAYTQWVHFALTSEDINNIAYTTMWRDALHAIYIPKLVQTHNALQACAKKYKATPLLSLTHGQSATPTTLGKEFAVFANRLNRQITQLKKHAFLGKLGGATGTWSAHHVCFPNVHWVAFTKKFLTNLGLEPNVVTTQIEPHDSLVESYHILHRANSILLDFTRDVWLYISRGVFAQKRIAGEVGSSTMPHKINPINFENAEGNLGIANAYLAHFASKLPISRFQRDLSDSTVLRNQGVPLGHGLLACIHILKGMEKLVVNNEVLETELANHPEVLTEAVQTVLRAYGHKNAYEQLKKVSRGQVITLNTLRAFIKKLAIPESDKKRLLKLEPKDYTGLAEKVAD